MGTARPNWRRVGRALSWAIAACALGFVAWVIPVRDRCWDPEARVSTRVAISRDASGCMLHLRTGEVHVPAVECARLQCEPGLATALEGTRPSILGALLAVYAVGSLAWAARWRVLLGFAGIDLTLSRVWRISIEAQAGGILLPGGLGGDALRIASVLARPTRPGEPRAPATIVVASVLLDRVIGLSLIAGLASVLGFAFGGLHAGVLAGLLAAIPVAFLASLVLLRRPASTGLRWLPTRRFDRWVGPVLAYVREPRAPRAIVVAGALSLVVAAVQFGVIRGLVFALGGAPTQEKWIYVGAAMALIVAAVPALPGGWGTADAAYVFFFGLAGLRPGLALAVCLLYRLFWYISGAVGAVLQLTGPSAAPRETVSPTHTT
jgi:glycosyltransferase 2 family protein